MYTYYSNIFFFFLEALSKYKHKNNKLPNSIIIYRDGVGDGQLSYVHQTEVNMIKVCIYNIYIISLLNKYVHIMLVIKFNINNLVYSKLVKISMERKKLAWHLLSLKNESVQDFFLTIQEIMQIHHLGQ